MVGHFLGRLSPHATPKQSAELRVGATPALFSLKKNSVFVERLRGLGEYRVGRMVG